MVQDLFINKMATDKEELQQTLLKLYRDFEQQPEALTSLKKLRDLIF